MAGHALRGIDLFARLQRRRIVDVLDLDLAHRLDALRDRLRGHAGAAGGRHLVGDDIVDEQDDGNDRHHECGDHRPHQLLGRLDRAFVRQVVIGVGVAH